MRTTVEITFALMSDDVPSAFELVNGEDQFLDAVSRMLDALKASATTAEAPIMWRTPFPNGNDPSYVDALGSYASTLHLIVAGLARDALASVSPCPAEPLRDIVPQMLASLRELTDAGPQFRIVFTESSKCDPCGKDCHKVDGKVEKSCPGGSAYSPLVWVSASHGKVVSYQIGVNYRFVRRDD
jgi:hypothetical protein